MPERRREDDLVEVSEINGGLRIDRELVRRKRVLVHLSRRCEECLARLQGLAVTICQVLFVSVRMRWTADVRLDRMGEGGGGERGGSPRIDERRIEG